MAALGDLVANFIATTGGFTKPVADMRKQTASAAASIKASITGISSAFAPLMSIVAPIAGAFAFKHVVDSAREAAGSAKKFQAVLTATGGAAGLSTKEMQEFAGELQKTTNFEDDATVGAAAMLASFTNIRGDVFKETVKAAMDLSTIMGMDLNSSIMLLGKAMNDPLNGIKKLSKAGVQLTEEQKKQIANFQKQGNIVGAQGVLLDALSGKFGGAAQAMASPFTQIKNIIGDISENIGFALLPVLKEITAVVIDWAGPLQNATDLFKQFGEDVAFEFRNFANLFKVTGINLELAIIEAFPGIAEGFQVVGAAINSVWEGSKAGWDVFQQDVMAGIQEMTHGFVEMIAKEVTAMLTLGLASKEQRDAIGKLVADTALPAREGKGIADAFKEARDKALKDFEILPADKFSDKLKAKRDKLLDDINNAEDKRKKAAEREPGAKPELPGQKSGPGQQTAEAAVFNSKEALHTIISAMGSATKSDAEITNDLLQEGLDKDDEMIDGIGEVAKNLGNVDFVAVVV